VGRVAVTVSYASDEQKAVNRPRYSFAEADRIARVTRGTASRWLKGYQYWHSFEERRMSPPVTPGQDSKEAVSFVDLMEVAAIGKLREKGFSLRRIRQINEYCMLALQKERPLVTETFRVRGHDIFIHASQGVLLNVGYEAGMQAWEEVLDPFLDTVEYENELVRRWWPLGKDVGVLVDPDYGFGLPVIAGTGIRTEIIAERKRAGDSNKEITYDFGVTADQIDDALRWEMPDAA
jgi:uncharacterized protein (DUF433 family)